MQLTAQQEDIKATIRDFPDQSLMVDARAGSAKTTTIEMAAKEVHTSPNLAVAFNKRIADELRGRLPSNFECLTLNSLGNRAWSGAIGGFSKVDPDKMNKIVKAIFQERAIGYEDEELFGEVLALARGAKSGGIVPKGAPMGRTGILPDSDRIWEDIAFAKGFDLRDQALDLARQVVLRSIKAAYSKDIDFDDQIYMSVLFGGTYPRYHTVIVDEAQDLSPLNHEQLVRATAVRLIAVGDPYQAIYAFRGADDNSMTKLMDRFVFERRGLTYSFRCPKLVSLRQRDHVPDFESFHTVGDGEVKNWHEWSLSQLPTEGFILCRNNAPLMKLAFTLIKNRRPVKILGRDIGASLAALLNRICLKQDLPVQDAVELVKGWELREVQKVEDSPSKAESIHDRAECLFVLLDTSEAKTALEAQRFIKELFADKAEGLVLASVHKAKGLESNWVMHLDPWRVPSKQAQRAMEHGNPAPMIQELNLKYVCETRTKHTLVNASLDDCEEIEG